MTTYFSFTLFFVSSLILGFSQNLIETYPIIERDVQRINQDKYLQIIELENEEFLENMTDGGGMLKGFYNEKNQFRKIEIKAYLSYGIQEYEFYLNKNLPILIIDRFNQFKWNNKTGSFDYNELETTFKGTYIFHKGHLVDHTSIGHNRFEDDNINIEETFLKELNYYITTIKKALDKK